MADTKISALTAATTPLAGTEVLPIVQSGVTKQVSVANLTAGRAVSGLTFTSTVATGTAPFTVSSTTEVANLTAANATNATTAANLKSNATTGVMQIVGPAAASTRVMTIPDANFTVARTDAGQTFSGTQIFTSPRIITGINDTNGNQLFALTATASAVNQITVANAATGANPSLTMSGSDSNIGLDLQMKGTGATRILSGSSSTALSTLNNLRIQSSNGLADPAGDVYITASIDSATAGDRGTAMLLKTGRTGGVVTNMALWSTGGVSIGNSTDPGAKNLSVSGFAGIGDATLSEWFNVNGTSRYTYIDYQKNASSLAKAGTDSINTYYNVICNGSGGVYLSSGATSWSALSDERYKDIIEPIVNAVDKVSTLRTVIGKYKDDPENTRRSFLIAQDVQAVLPEAITISKEEQRLGLAYTDVIPLLVAAIKELKTEIDILKGGK